MELTYNDFIFADSTSLIITLLDSERCTQQNKNHAPRVLDLKVPIEQLMGDLPKLRV